MDIDIDFPTTFDPLDIFETAVRASRINNDQLLKHPCGIYLQNIPIDPITSLSAIPHKEAEDLGYFKIDFLHLSILDNFTSKDEVRQLLKIDPDWNMLLDHEVIAKLFHLSKWPDVLLTVKPRSVPQLADCLALIRPKKQHLLHQYHKNKEATVKELYTIEYGDKTSFKRGHAISYALVIVLQLHLIKGGLYQE